MGSPWGGKFNIRRPHSAVNVHTMSMAPDRAFGTRQANSTSSREEVCRGADMNPVRNTESGSGAGQVAGGQSGGLIKVVAS